MSDAQQQRRAAAAERMRHSRARRRDGFRTVLIDIHQRQVDELIRRGLLPPERVGDPVAIGEAAGKLLDAAAPW